jgi:phosphatidylserine decarboxylase
MLDYNFYYVKFYTPIIINSKYSIELYCNNFNYYDDYFIGQSYLTFNPIIVPKYYKQIYVQFKNTYDTTSIFYIPNKIGLYRVNIEEDQFYISIKYINNVPLDILNIPNYNLIENNNTYVYHTELKTLIPEIVNNTWLLINEYLSNASLNTTIRQYITKYIGYFLKSNLSAFYINSFIRSYNIDPTKYIKLKYLSFNDFFTRRLFIEPIIIKDKILYFRSPATSRLVTFKNINQTNFNTWIKGSEFTIQKLIDETSNVSSMFICRLAVQDYHHFHMPYTGILKSIKTIGTDYYSVQPGLLNSSVNVLTENYRQIYKFIGTINDTEFTFWIVAVGALIAGTIENIMTIDNTYYSGERIGNFSLGGSTIIVLSSININMNADIEYYSGLNFESFVKVGDNIGSINELNEIIEFPKTYYITNDNTNTSYVFDNDSVIIIKYISIIFIFFIIIKIFIMINKK